MDKTKFLPENEQATNKKDTKTINYYNFLYGNSVLGNVESKKE